LNNELRIKTWQMLKTRNVDIKITNISKETGLEVEWLRSFLQRGEEKDSGSDKIVTLYNYLNPVKLEI